MKKFTLLSLCAMLFTFSVFAQDPPVVNFEVVEKPLTLGDLPMTASGQEVWGDYNNDGLIDMFIAAGQGSPFSALYKNNGNGTFTEVVTDITKLTLASAVFFDYDNDGNLDLLTAGSTDGKATSPVTKLYHNSGAPDYKFVLNSTVALVAISSESGDNNTRLLEVVDYNNDGWMDVFMSGNAGSTWSVSGNSRVVALYKNNQGTFVLQDKAVDGTKNFVSMNGGGIHCGDINNDGLADMIVSGYVDGTIQTATDLYINKGDGTFSFLANSRTIFAGHTQGETFFADINNDGWMDIVEIGRDVNKAWAGFANMYLNNKDLTFTKKESSATGLIGGGAVVATGDINNDGKVDLAASGYGPSMTFFYNKGNNTFLASPVNPDKARARAGCINFVDFNKDGNLDFTVFGYRDGGDGTATNPTWPDYILKNNLGTGIIANKAPSAPLNVSAKNNGSDVVITWGKPTDDTTPVDAIRYNIYAKAKTGSKVFSYFPANISTGLLSANGVRPFISGTTITLKGMSTADYTFGVQAIDNGNMGSVFTTASVIVSGPAVVNWSIVEKPLTLGDLPMTASGQEIWGDYNNDGFIDMFIVAGQGNPFSALYKNNGNGTFTEVLTDVTMLTLSSAVFFDYDNDGNLDLLIAGSVDGTASATLTELYRNSGAPDYKLVLNDKADFLGISSESGDNNTRLLEAVDYNNDGWLDVFMSGNAGSAWSVSGNSRAVALYKNNQGTFVLQDKVVDGTKNFVSMNGGGIHCGDVNNDGFVDMIVSGYVDGTIQTVTDLYINKGNGTFTYYANSRTTFTGHTQGETFFADINNDGWMDIVEIGRDVNKGWAGFANLYINNKDLTFTKSESGVTGLLGGGAVVATGDINNDGKVDIAASGWGPNMTFFYNKGNNTFLASPIDPDKARARAGCINFVDFNKDGTLDFTVFGYRDGGAGTAENPTWPDYILKNNLGTGIAANKAPLAPLNVVAANSGTDVVLTWGKSTDDSTPADAIRYNVYAKAKTGTKVFTYFPSDIKTGLLSASGVRPFISGTTITLKGMSTANYTFGVQAVDNANLGSAFTVGTVTSSIILKKMDVSIYGRERMIIINNRQDTQLSYKVFTLNGQAVMAGVCDANGTSELSTSLRGIFLVQVSDKFSTRVEKVMVY